MVISTFSGGGNCVNVDFLSDGRVAVNHSRTLSAEPLIICGYQYVALIRAVCSDGTISEVATGLQFEKCDDRSVTLCNDCVKLVFTADEWSAFVRGVKAGEFDRPGPA